MTAAPVAQVGGVRGDVAHLRVDTLFEHHGRMVYGLCRAILRDPADAEDAAQAAFLKAHEALLRGTRVRKPGAWLAAIARNECRALATTRSHAPAELHENDLVGTTTPELELERSMLTSSLRTAIASLPELQREAVVLRDLYGLRYAEVGAALGVSRASVESLLFRARRSLRVRLRPPTGSALTVPVTLHERVAELAQHGGYGPAIGGVAGGAGVIGALAGAPLGAKVAAGALALGAAAALGGATIDPAAHSRGRPRSITLPSTPIEGGSGGERLGGERQSLKGLRIRAAGIAVAAGARSPSVTKPTVGTQAQATRSALSGPTTPEPSRPDAPPAQPGSDPAAPRRQAPDARTTERTTALRPTNPIRVPRARETPTPLSPPPPAPETALAIDPSRPTETPSPQARVRDSGR